MTRLVQISDTHFGTERPAVLQALEAWVHAQAPDAVLLTGDITQRATRAQFEAARAFVQRLGVPAALAIPGNHDIPLFNLALRGLAPYARYRRAFGPDLEPVLERPDCLVLGLNTTRWYRHQDGEVSAAQIARVERRLQQARAAQLRIVLVHQPVAVTRPEDARNLLHGHAQAVARWSAAGADLVLGGHIHLPFVRPLPTARPMWAVQAGTAVSARVRAGTPNSVNLIHGHTSEGRKRRCTVERWDHSQATGRFERADLQHLPLAPPAVSSSGHGA